jgi:hypothetical protein
MKSLRNGKKENTIHISLIDAEYAASQIPLPKAVA